MKFSFRKPLLEDNASKVKDKLVARIATMYPGIDKEDIEQHHINGDHNKNSQLNQLEIYAPERKVAAEIHKYMHALALVKRFKQNPSIIKDAYVYFLKESKITKQKITLSLLDRYADILFRCKDTLKNLPEEGTEEDN